MSDYLMEHPAEAERLWNKSDPAEILRQLRATGFEELPNAPVVMDVGCGSGFVGSVMARELEHRHERSSLILVDSSAERLAVARERVPARPQVNVEYVTADVEQNHPTRRESVDYVFSRFLFEYLRTPRACFGRLVDTLKCGGKIVVADLDYNCLSHYPLDAELEQQLRELFDVLVGESRFDPYAGRKLYHLFCSYGLSNIKVHFAAHHLFYGPLGEADRRNWQAKIDQMARLQEAAELTVGFDVREFGKRFMHFLLSEDRFSYTPMITVEGTKS